MLTRYWIRTKEIKFKNHLKTFKCLIFTKNLISKLNSISLEGRKVLKLTTQLLDLDNIPFFDKSQKKNEQTCPEESGLRNSNRFQEVTKKPRKIGVFFVSSADGTILELIVTWKQFRKTDWIAEIEYPELTLQNTQQLLAIPT